MTTKVEVIVGDRKGSEFVYSDGSVILPTGPGAPRKTNNEGYPLVLIRKYVLPVTKRQYKPKPPVIPAAKETLLQVDTLDEVGTFLKYSNGKTVKSGKGRPAKFLGEAHLVEIIKKTLKPTGKKGLSSGIETVEVPVMDPKEVRIEYTYGDVKVVREPGTLGRPAVVKDGKPLSKITRYVLNQDSAAVPQDEVEDETVGLTLVRSQEFRVGDRVVLEGSTRVGRVQVVRSDYISVKYPGGGQSDPMYNSVFKVQ